MFKKLTTDRLLYFFIALALITALGLTAYRCYVESQNRTVELVADYDDLIALVAMTGVPMNQLLSLTAKAGVTSLGVNEDTLVSLEKSGQAIALAGYEVIAANQSGQSNAVASLAIRSTTPKADNTYIYTADSLLLERMRTALMREVGDANVKSYSGGLLEVTGREADLGKLGLGFSSSALLTLNNYGFAVVPRILNSYRLDADRIAMKLASICENNKVFTVIFGMDNVLGYPDLYQAVADKLEPYGVNFGFVEFGRQKGDAQLATAMRDRTVKVHSVPALEISKLPPDVLVSRYLRAVQERNVRVLYLRSWLDFSVDRHLADANLKLFSQLAEHLHNQGFQTAPLQKPPFTLFFPPWWAVWLIGLGVLSFLVLIFRELTGMAWWQSGMVLGVACVGLLIITVVIPDPWPRKLVALLAASIIPAAILLRFFPEFSSFQSFQQSPKSVFGVCLKIFGASVAGGLIVSSLLVDPIAMLGIRPFTGVKIALAVPILIVLYHLLFSWKNVSAFPYRARRILESPVAVIHVLLAATLVGAGVFMLIRSGNAPESFTPGIEEKARYLLERILIVRPRFKEFLIGWPALVLLISLAGTWVSKRWYGLFLLAGVLAPLSVVNSFCHAHTPLWYSLWRVTNGFIVGMGIGFAVLFLVKTLFKSPFRGCDKTKSLFRTVNH
jgi:hypothetical protein